MSKDFGELRPSQLLFYHGPGSIVDMLSGSVMVMAADLWKVPSTNEVEDERIKRALGVSKIRLLNVNQEKLDIKAKRFPSWKVCPKCGMMTNWKSSECYYCKKDRDASIELFPSRFVLACRHGHIKDFPWDVWVHRGKSCEKPLLKMTSRGMAGSLSDMTIQCLKCKTRRSLASILKEEVECTGDRPWIGDFEDECDLTMEPVLRGAAKLYSPILFSALSIPLREGTEDSLAIKVAKNREALLSTKQISEEVYRQLAMSLLNIDEGKLSLVEKILNGDYEETMSFESIRKQEWNTLIAKNIDDLNDTGYKAVEVEIHPNMEKYFSSIVKVESLPEIQVLRGFTRLHYPDPFDMSDLPISSIMKNDKINWLPAVKNLGEGIFFQFDQNQLLKWEQREDVKVESKKIFNRYNKRREQMGNIPISLKERTLLLHTFSHAMIQEFARFSGYATTSLRERIYCSDEMYGVLIYTASSDSEGSLGGLIELSKHEKLNNIFVRALAKMEFCSSDPHCSDADFEFQSTVNGAACHACSFVSETSCEWGNQLLDRRMLLPISLKNLAFFEF